MLLELMNDGTLPADISEYPTKAGGVGSKSISPISRMRRSPRKMERSEGNTCAARRRELNARREHLIRPLAYADSPDAATCAATTINSESPPVVSMSNSAFRADPPSEKAVRQAASWLYSGAGAAKTNPPQSRPQSIDYRSRHRYRSLKIQPVISGTRS